MVLRRAWSLDSKWLLSACMLFFHSCSAQGMVDGKDMNPLFSQGNNYVTLMHKLVQQEPCGVANTKILQQGESRRNKAQSWYVTCSEHVNQHMCMAVSASAFGINYT